LTGLIALQLGNTQVSDAGVQEFTRSHPNCSGVKW
jgi:hypothetical protein